MIRIIEVIIVLFDRYGVRSTVAWINSDVGLQVAALSCHYLSRKSAVSTQTVVIDRAQQQEFQLKNYQTNTTEKAILQRHQDAISNKLANRPVLNKSAYS